MFDLSSGWQPYLTCHKIALGLAFTTKPRRTRGSSNATNKCMQISVALWVYSRAFHFSPRGNELVASLRDSTNLIERISSDQSLPKKLPFLVSRTKKNSNEITRDTFIRGRRKKRYFFLSFFSIPPLSPNAERERNEHPPVDKEGGEGRREINLLKARGENRVTLGKSGLIPSKTI